MSAAVSPPLVEFPSGYDGRAEFETPARGYLSHVVVRGSGGNAYQLYFIDPARLQQTLEDDIANGRAFFAEPGLIVLPLVTSEAIKVTVAELWREGFFQHLKPL